MELDWEINEFRVLKAKVGEVTYYVAPGMISLWKPSKRFVAFDGKVEVEGAVDGMSLTNAIAWCERDAERPVQPPAADPADSASKFPSTMDAKEWAAGFVKEGVEPQDYLGVDSEEALVAWFQAALSHGYDEGVQTCIREGLPNGEPGPARTMTASQYLAWKQTNVPPPIAQAPEPPNVEEAARLSRPVTQVDVEQYVGKVVKSHFDLLWKHVETMPVRMEGLSGPETRRNVEALSGRLSDLEARVMGNSAELPMQGRRIEELEAEVAAHERSLSFHAKRLEKLEAKA